MHLWDKNPPNWLEMDFSPQNRQGRSFCTAGHGFCFTVAMLVVLTRGAAEPSSPSPPVSPRPQHLAMTNFGLFCPKSWPWGGLRAGDPPLLGAKTGAKWQSTGQNVSLGPFHGGKCPFGGDLRSKSRFWGDFLGQEIGPVAIWWSKTGQNVDFEGLFWGGGIRPEVIWWLSWAKKVNFRAFS